MLGKMRSTHRQTNKYSVAAEPQPQAEHDVLHSVRSEIFKQ